MALRAFFNPFLRKLAAESLHELLQLGQGVLDQEPELAFRQPLVGLVAEQVEGAEHQLARLEQGGSAEKNAAWYRMVKLKNATWYRVVKFKNAAFHRRAQ
jgi:hypothetical protein